jgi:hypothetical protein
MMRCVPANVVDLLLEVEELVEDIMRVRSPGCCVTCCPSEVAVFAAVATSWVRVEIVVLAVSDVGCEVLRAVA